MSKESTPKSREKLLLIVFLGMLTVLSVPLFMYLYGSDVTQMQRNKTTLQEEIKELSNTTRTLASDEKRILADAAKALPRNDELAASNYKNWLAGLAQQCLFEGGKVTHDSTRPLTARVARGAKVVGPTEYYRKAQFTVTGKTTLSYMGEFLKRFYEINALHLIKSINIKPIDNAKRIDVTFVIEALSLPQTKNTDIVLDKIPDDISSWNKMIQNVSSRNLFATYQEPARIEETGAPPQMADVTLNTFLCGITSSNGVPQAWFDFRLEGRYRILKIGNSFRVGNANCVVKAINKETVEIETGRMLFSMRRGDAFFDSELLRDYAEEERLAKEKQEANQPNNDQPNNDQLNNDQPNNDQPNNDQPNNDQLNNDQLNNDQLNNDQLNNDQLNNDQLNNEGKSDEKE